MNAPQPCAGPCGTLVPPHRGRRAGQPWWCTAPACRAARRRHHYANAVARAGAPAPGPAPEAKTCPACGGAVPRGPGRRPAVDWYCSTRWCQAEGRRRRMVAWRRRHGMPERQRSACEHCRHSYYPMPGRVSRWALCSRPPCAREYTRRSEAAIRARRAAA